MIGPLNRIEIAVAANAVGGEKTQLFNGLLKPFARRINVFLAKKASHKGRKFSSIRIIQLIEPLSVWQIPESHCAA